MAHADAAIFSTQKVVFKKGGMLVFEHSRVIPLQIYKFVHAGKLNLELPNTTGKTMSFSVAAISSLPNSPGSIVSAVIYKP